MSVLIVDPYHHFHPLDLFAGGEDGFFLDFKEKSTLFQNSNFTSPVTTDGQSVASIRDMTANGRDFVQVSGESPLLWNENGDSPYVDTGDDTGGGSIRCVDTPDFAYDAGQCTLFVALNATNPAGGFGHIMSEANTASSAAVYSLLQRDGAADDGGSTEFIRNNAFGSISVAQLTVINAMDATPNTFIITDTGSALEAFVDGLSIDTASYTRSGVVTLDRFTIGALQRNTISQGNVTDIWSCGVIDRVLTVGEIASINTWLAAQQKRSI